MLPGARANTQGITSLVVPAVDGEAAVVLETPGIYYLACRDSAADDWVRLGVVEVRSLVDPQETKLRREITLLDERIASKEAMIYGLTGADGMQVQRGFRAPPPLRRPPQAPPGW